MSVLQQFKDITGLSDIEAQQYINIAGHGDGQLDRALNMFFDGGIGFIDNSFEQSNNDNIPDYYSLIWPNNEPIKDCWLEQSLQFSKEIKIGIEQVKNGPCGVLSIIQGLLIADRLSKNIFSYNEFTKEEITNVLTKIITNCKRNNNNSDYSVVLWGNTFGKDITVTKYKEKSQVYDFILKNLDSYMNKGCLILLIYSCIETHTIELTKTEILSSGGNPPLIYGTYWMCTTDLMSLLLRGIADGNTGAYDINGNIRCKEFIDNPCDIGLLSYAELESGICIADGYKSPLYPVWIIHGGDHFTILFNESNTSTSDDIPPLNLCHWNGLPPAGPKLIKFQLKGDSIAQKAKPHQQPKYIKPLPGEIEDIVQAVPSDKEQYPKEWKKWKYEAVLAIDNPDILDTNNHSLSEIKVFEQGNVSVISNKPWRCAYCYRKRFETMCFGQNKENNDYCQYCNKHKLEAGWSIEIPYNELPKTWQNKMTLRHAPKILSVLRTKWPLCSITLLDNEKEYPSI